MTNNEKMPGTAGRSPRRSPGEMIRRDGFTWELTLPSHQELYNLLYSQPPGRRRAFMQELMLKGLQGHQSGSVVAQAPVVAPAPVLPPIARPAAAARAPIVPAMAQPETTPGKVKLGAVKGFKA